jgi:hypothetical protein
MRQPFFLLSFTRMPHGLPWGGFTFVDTIGGGRKLLTLQQYNNYFTGNIFWE